MGATEEAQHHQAIFHRQCGDVLVEVRTAQDVQDHIDSVASRFFSDNLVGLIVMVDCFCTQLTNYGTFFFAACGDSDNVGGAYAILFPVEAPSYTTLDVGAT